MQAFKGKKEKEGAGKKYTYTEMREMRRGEMRRRRRTR